LIHDRQGLLAEQKDAADVDGEGLIELLGGHAFEGARKEDPRVVDEDIQACKALDGAVEQGFDFFVSAEVQGQGQCPRPLALDLLGRVLQLPLASR
jgi:hypothetical protein